MFELIKSFQFTKDNFIISLITLGIYLVFAFLLDLFISKVIKTITKRTKTHIDDLLIAHLQRPILLSLIFFGFILTSKGLKLDPWLLVLSHKIVYTLLVIIWSVALFKMSRLLIIDSFLKLFDVSGIRKESIPLIISLTKVAILITTLFVILTVWEMNLTPFVASAGVVSIVAALAARDTIANFFGGLSIFLDKPYVIGDYIELEGNERGEVVEIGLRSTSIKTRDDILISIPNSIIANTKIINESAPVANFRVRVPISVAHGTDLNKMENILIEIANNNDNIIPEPAPRVRFRTFGESAINYELLCWAKEPALRGLTIHEINKDIYNRFQEEKILIPFPQYDLHITEPRK